MARRGRSNRFNSADDRAPITEVSPLAAAQTPPHVPGDTAVGQPDTVTPPSAPAQLIVNPIAGNHVVNAAEAANGVVVSGTGEPGSRIDLRWHGSDTVLAGETFVDTDGNWSYTFTSTPGQGGSTLYVEDFIAANGEVDGISIEIDTVAPDEPTINAVEGDNVISAAEAADGVAVSGTAEAGAAIVVTWGDVSRTGTADNAGNWSVNFDTVPVVGDATISAVATDSAGNPSAAATLDVTANLVAPLTVNPVAGDNVIDAGEAAGGVVISGTAQPGATIDLRWHGTETALAGEAYADSDGNWSYTFASTPGPGASTLYVEDFLSGNDDVPGIDIQIGTADAVPLTMNAVAGDNVVNAAEAAAGVVISGTARPGATIDLRWHGSDTALAGEAYTDSDGNWSYTFTSTPGQGDSTLYVEDFIAGNDDLPGQTIHIDTIAPDAPGIDTVEGDNVITSAEAADGVQIRGSAEAGATVAVTWGDVTQTGAADANGNWMVNFATVPVTGASTIEAVATDSAGNTGTTGTLDVVANLTAPLTMNPVTGDNYIDASEAASGILVTGTAQPGALIDLRWHGSETALAGETFADENGNWSYTFTSTPGPGDSTLYAEDFLSGNEDLPGMSIEVASTAPLTVNPIAGDNVIDAGEAAGGVIVSGTAQADATIDIRWFGSDTALAGEAYTDSDGNWSYTFDTLPGQGESVLYVEDFLAGNDDVEGISILIDTDTPSDVATLSLGTTPDSGDTATGADIAAEPYSYAATADTAGSPGVNYDWTNNPVL